MGFTLEFLNVCSLSHECFERFSLNFTQNVPLNETVCSSHDSAMQSQGQGLTSRSWDSVAEDLAVLQTAVLIVNFLLTRFLKVAHGRLHGVRQKIERQKRETRFNRCVKTKKRHLIER